MRSYIQHRNVDMTAHDPFTIGAAIVTFASAGGGAALGYGAFVAASYIVGSVVVGGLLAGAQYALSKTLTDKANKGFGGGNVGLINSPQSRGNIRQATPIRRVIYGGPVRAGGAVSFFDDSKPPFFYLQLLHSCRPLWEITGARVGINALSFSAFVPDTILTPLPGSSPDYSAHLQLAVGEGYADQAICPLLDAQFPNLPSTFRQRGAARTTWRFKRDANGTTDEGLWGPGAPIPAPFLDIGNGAPVYDPRDPTQRYPEDWNDAADVAEATATWKGQTNASLVQADWLGWPDGMNHPADRIRWDEIARSAEYDDEMVGTESGTPIRRYEIAGVVNLDQKPRDVMEAMGTANRGFIVLERGRGWIASSYPREPVLTITDDLLVGGFDFRDDRPKLDTMNKNTSRFSSSDRNYQDIDGPVLKRDDLIALDGEVLAQTVRLPFTADYRAVERLQKQYLEESRLPRAITCKIKLRGRKVRVGDCVRFQTRWYERPNGLYTVQEKSLSFGAQPAISLALTEYDPAIADWNHEIDEAPFTLPDLNVS